MDRWQMNAGIVAAVSVVLLVAGCKTHTKHTDSPPVSPPPRAAEPGPATRADIGQTLATPSILAHRSEEHARELEAMLAQRRSRPRSSGTIEASEVSWADPKALPPAEKPAVPSGVDAMNEGESRRATRNAARLAPQAALETAASANQIAAVTSAAQVPAGAVSPVSMERLVAAPGDDAPAGLEQKLIQGVKDNTRDAAIHLDYQLLQFLKDESVPQLQALAPLPQEDREMLSAVLDGLSNFRGALRADNNLLLSRKVRPLIEMADRLRAQADLTIPTALLCTKVDGFGVYEPIEPARFIAGKEHPVIIYCEVENFSSHQNDKKQWETHLRQEEVLYTEMGMQVWPEKPVTRTITDLSRNRRHDFFVVKLVKLPAGLTIGRYLLKVSIIDERAARVAEATIPIQIVAQ